MAKSKNHTAHNQSFKAHRNGIKKPRRHRKTSTKGVGALELFFLLFILRLFPKVLFGWFFAVSLDSGSSFWLFSLPLSLSYTYARARTHTHAHIYFFISSLFHHRSPALLRRCSGFILIDMAISSHSMEASVLKTCADLCRWIQNSWGIRGTRGSITSRTGPQVSRRNRWHEERPLDELLKTIGCSSLWIIPGGMNLFSVLSGSTSHPKLDDQP